MFIKPDYNLKSIYDINFDNNDDGEFAMEVTMDSKMISKIRAYNELHEDDGGYLNNTLDCYDHENSEDGKTYKNIYCYSTFLDKIIEETGGPGKNGGSDKIKIVGGTRYFTEGDRKTKTQEGGIWTTWSESNPNDWKITTETELAHYQKNYKSLGIGPSWK